MSGIRWPPGDKGRMSAIGVLPYALDHFDFSVVVKNTRFEFLTDASHGKDGAQAAAQRTS